MKTNLIKTLLVSFLALFSCKEQPVSRKVNNGDCFSKENFEIAYNFVSKQTKENKYPYEYEEYELSIEKDMITCKKKDSFFSKISKEKGAFSLAIYAPDNDRITAKTNQMFCNLVSSIK